MTPVDVNSHSSSWVSTADYIRKHRLPGVAKQVPMAPEPPVRPSAWHKPLQAHQGLTPIGSGGP